MPFKNMEKFCAAYKQLEAKGGLYSWTALDRALIGVCSATPHHVRVDEVFAKVAIINRTYRANLQLGARDAEWKVAEQFVNKGAADAIIAPLRRFSKFSSEALPSLLDSHEKLAKLVQKITKTVQNAFVSKYLHFHFPDTVPIFDSYSYNASWGLAPPPESEFGQYDQRLTRDYGYHCGALLQIIGQLRERGVESPKVKLLDVLLYGTRPDGQVTHG
jgi:hypothetical protein